MLLFSWIAGLASFAGALLAYTERLHESTFKRELIHAVVAFGGGILVAAVAFALIPNGIEKLSPASLVVCFALGGIAFCCLDVQLSRQGGSKAQFVAMLSDFIPEAISLGAVFAHDHRLGILLALFIGAQNLPEGFNAFRELRATHAKARHVLVAMALISLAGPVSAWLGNAFLRPYPSVTAAIMTFAGGGILYLVFQDIAPASKMRKRWTPTLGAVLGFLVGMLGKKLLG